VESGSESFLVEKVFMIIIQFAERHCNQQRLRPRSSQHQADQQSLSSTNKLSDAVYLPSLLFDNARKMFPSFHQQVITSRFVERSRLPAWALCVFHPSPFRGVPDPGKKKVQRNRHRIVNETAT
jgi:hypothetical protein